MSSAGHLFDAIGRMKANAALRRGKRAEFKRVRKMYVDSFAWRSFHKQPHKEVSREEFQRLKLQIKKEVKDSIRKQNKKRLVILFVAFVTLVVLLASFYSI